MAFSFFVLYDDGNVAIHDESGGVADAVSIPDYVPSSFTEYKPQIAANGDTIVVVNFNNIITVQGAVSSIYNITGCPDIDYFPSAAPVSFSYYAGKYRLLVTYKNRAPCSGSWWYGAFLYLESSDGVVWDEIFDFGENEIGGDYLGYPEVSYNATDGYYYIVDTGFWGGNIYRTTDFVSFALFAAKPTSRRVTYAPVYEGTYVWYTQQYSSNSQYLREIRKSGATYAVSGVPGTINADELSDWYGVLLDADGTPYLYLYENDSVDGRQYTAYFFNGSSFARDASTTTLGGYPSFGRLKPLEYATSGGAGVVLSLVDTYTGYTDPHSIAVRKEGKCSIIAALTGYSIDVALNGYYASSSEFWTEEKLALESKYDY